MRASETLSDAKGQNEGHWAGRQACRKQEGHHAPYQHRPSRGFLSKPLGVHHHHDLVHEYRLTEPNSHSQEQTGVGDPSRDRKAAPDRHPAVNCRRKTVDAWCLAADGRFHSCFRVLKAILGRSMAAHL
jgi:hypothetical protein